MAFSNVTWSDCEVITETFKSVKDHQVKVDILLPPALKAGRHPLIIAYHGGYLIAGSRNHYMFMAAWLPAYAASKSAIIISPDHRLFPSASTSDILSDLEDLWLWVNTILPEVLSSRLPGHEVDLSKVLVEGNSAGGFCAAHLAINHATSIRAAILVYPMVDCLSQYLAKGPPENLAATAPFRGEMLDERIQAVRQEGWVCERTDKEGVQLTLSIMRDGRFGEIFGTDEQHNPLHQVQKMKQILPRTWVLHGKDDTGVPAQGSIDFANEVKKSQPQSELILDVVDDEPSEHGFDSKWTINNQKLTKRLSWISEAWLN